MVYLHSAVHQLHEDNIKRNWCSDLAILIDTSTQLGKLTVKASAYHTDVIPQPVISSTLNASNLLKLERFTKEIWFKALSLAFAEGRFSGAGPHISHDP